MATVVVYVHGLWMPGFEGFLLRHRLARQLQAVAPRFSYPSIHSDISTNARSLGRQLGQLRADTLHLVGHSLGGLVIYRLLHAADRLVLPPGRVVLMGSPLSGCRAAHNLSSWAIGRAIMGRGVAEELLPPRERIWTAERELGVLAGTINVGIGQLVNTHKAPSDGTIYVDETRIVGAKEHRAVPVTHTGMPFSRKVAACVSTFLSTGTFGST
jgi:pimeloyl-ACP methyl ester carboxylesterase